MTEADLRRMRTKARGKFNIWREEYGREMGNTAEEKQGKRRAGVEASTETQQTATDGGSQHE